MLARNVLQILGLKKKNRNVKGELKNPVTNQVVLERLICLHILSCKMEVIKTAAL